MFAKVNQLQFAHGCANQILDLIFVRRLMTRTWWQSNLSPSFEISLGLHSLQHVVGCTLPCASTPNAQGCCMCWVTKLHIFLLAFLLRLTAINQWYKWIWGHSCPAMEIWKRLCQGCGPMTLVPATWWHISTFQTLARQLIPWISSPLFLSAAAAAYQEAWDQGSILKGQEMGTRCFGLEQEAKHSSCAWTQVSLTYCCCDRASGAGFVSPSFSLLKWVQWSRK